MENWRLAVLVGRALVWAKSDEDRSSRLRRRSGFVAAKARAGTDWICCQNRLASSLAPPIWLKLAITGISPLARSNSPPQTGNISLIPFVSTHLG
jgi:hypothetical protein